MEQLELYIPKPDELWFYQKMMSDPETMSYNANWDVSYDGYHRDTGCIDFPEEAWADWYAWWIGKEPQRFYAYIRRCSDGVWIGDVNFHYTPEKDWWDMGIVIYAPYRGMGYAVPALRQMLDHAFRNCGISRIHNDFAVVRQEVSAWETHRKAGFKELGVKDGFLQMMITREDYLSQNKIQLICQDEKSWRVFDSGTEIGTIAVYRNPCHNEHSCLKLELTHYDPAISAALFPMLRQQLGNPLQVMEYVSPSMAEFLSAAGFERKRQCYELEARASDLKEKSCKATMLTKAVKGTPNYARCCRLLYDYYRMTHESVSRLTADEATFCMTLPETVFLNQEGEEITHCAFVEVDGTKCEIAYIATKMQAEVKVFLQTLAAELFCRYERITAECDDTDPAAMELKSLFCVPDTATYDTYIL